MGIGDGDHLAQTRDTSCRQCWWGCQKSADGIITPRVEDVMYKGHKGKIIEHI